MKIEFSHRGFSLLEILVAFSISSITLALIYQVYAGGARAVMLGKEYAQATMIAESKLAEMTPAGNIELVERQGKAAGKYTWQIVVSDYPENDELDYDSFLLLNKIMVEVSWKNRNQRRSVTLHSIRPQAAL